MKNDVNDIKNILETQETKARNKKDLENTLFVELYKFVKSFKGMTNGALVYIGITENKETLCKTVANTQEEYNFLIINYGKIYNKIKKAFEEDAKQEQREQQREMEQKEKETFTIFGVHWALFLFLFPVAILMILFDDLK